MSSDAVRDPFQIIEAFLSRDDVDAEVRTALLDLIAASYPDRTQATYDDLPVRGVHTASTVLRPTPGDVDTVLLTEPEDITVAASGPMAALGITRDAADYSQIGLIAVGGMGEVRRVRDEHLNRVLAMKVLRERYGEKPLLVARFLEEAQVTAQLGHPGIPPIHTIGQLADGRPYFTMKEVLGRTLTEVLHDVHRDDDDAERTWTIRRALDVFRKVCDAVAYAHARGVIHCDLKPANVMVAAYGEVLVMDWGLARVVQPADDIVKTDEPRVRTTMPESLQAPEGSVAGTPAYMPPEQAEAGPLDARTDVYALGVMLFELLLGERPYRGAPEWIYVQSRQGPTKIPVRSKGGHLVDPELTAIALKAMRPEPERRYSDAGAMSRELGAWLEGSRKREQALAIVQEARNDMPALSIKRERSQMLNDLAATRLSSLPVDASVEEKSSSWLLQDEAEDLDLEAELQLAEVTQRLHAALGHADVKEAHALLADIYYERHAAAERQRRWAAAAHAEVLLRAHDIGQYEDYLSGTGKLDLVTEPPCHVNLYKYARRARQLVAEEQGPLGATPLREVKLPVGSYVLELAAEGRPTVRYPVQIGRLYGWHGRAPGEREPRPVELPETGDLGDNEVYVPGGWFASGGDDHAVGATTRQRIWVDAFVIQRHPVTNAEYFAFLASERGEDALRTHLREHVDLWRPDWPVVGVPWRDALAYASWIARQTQLDWRLPTELEWEKAARGVDGRLFPWGDFVDPAFCHMRSASAPNLPKSINSFPGDESPYGVRGMGGNARDWCIDAFRPDGPVPTAADTAGDTVALRAVRGGSWRQPADGVRVAARMGLDPRLGHHDVGFRLARSL